MEDVAGSVVTEADSEGEVDSEDLEDITVGAGLTPGKDSLALSVGANLSWVLEETLGKALETSDSTAEAAEVGSLEKDHLEEPIAADQALVLEADALALDLEEVEVGSPEKADEVGLEAEAATDLDAEDLEVASKVKKKVSKLPKKHTSRNTTTRKVRRPKLGEPPSRSAKVGEREV